MGFWIFAGVIGAGTFIGIKRLRANPLLRALGANMNSFAEANRPGANSVFLTDRKIADRLEPVEVLAARRVA